MLGLVGAEAMLPGSERFSLFAEGRFEALSDIWKKRGGNWQYDDVGGITGLVGVRTRF